MENWIFCGVINPEFLFLIQDVEVIVNTPKKSAVFETLQKIFWRWCKMLEKTLSTSTFSWSVALKQQLCPLIILDFKGFQFI